MKTENGIMQQIVRPKTVTIIAKIMQPFIAEGVIRVVEEKEIVSNLRHLAKEGSMKPMIVPKLIDQRQAGEMMGIGLSSFKALEKAGAFPFKRKMVGSSVRYRNLEVLDFILAD